MRASEPREPPLSSTQLCVNAPACLARRLIVLPGPADILVIRHHAYREGMTHGAQGVRSLSVLLCSRPRQAAGA